MSPDFDALRVPIDTFVMELRPSEVKAVASGMRGTASQRSLSSLAAAVRSLPTGDRAPLWELAVRHYARGKSVEQAAAEIGMDPKHAQALLAGFSVALRQAGEGYNKG
jgi:hypothetical protein